MANNIKNKLAEALNTTPKAIRWLLLIAAFIVVLILLLLLTSKPKATSDKALDENRDVQLVVDPEKFEIQPIKVGEKRSQRLKVTATYDAFIDTVNVHHDDLPDFDVQMKSCVGKESGGFAVNPDIPCVIDITFIPTKAGVSGDATLVIEWYDQGDSRSTNLKKQEIQIPVSSVAAQMEQKKPEPVVISDPEPEPDPDPVPEPEPDPVPEPDPGDDDDGIVGGGNIFATESKPEPIQRSRAPEKCSDFAMPGYSTSGTQIGWIKPKDGRYEFHPFSDTDCNKPTGVYNPDTGFITSIDGKGTKIGTDAEHIKSTVDITNIPNLKSKPNAVVSRSDSGSSYKPGGMGNLRETFGNGFVKKDINEAALQGTGMEESVVSSMPYDRSFILRQFKPIPATIVSEVRADPSVYGCVFGNGATNCDGGTGIPVRATVDRNVYSDNGRTIIIPTGTLLMGYLTGELPGPYKSIGRMQIKWYQFIRPDGVEFNFNSDDQDPYSADSQGRVGVPGYGSTDYIEQMVMPLLTAMVPAAVNMIAPIADTFVNQIDLDNNTVVQSGKVRSSELAKNEVITAWNQVAQKLIVDALDNTVPPFSIAAGTRITVYSPVDLIATCGKDDKNAGKKCAFIEYGSAKRREWKNVKGQMKVDGSDSSWTGQSRGFNLSQYCKQEKDVWTVDNSQLQAIRDSGYDYRTVLAYCQSQNYQAKNQAKYDAYYQNKVDSGIQGVDKDGNAIQLKQGTKEYNEQVLGLQYAKNADGEDTDMIKNPFEKTAKPAAEETVGSLDCDGKAPDENGCCPGEVLTDMGANGFNCCPESDPNGDCFPPLDMK